MVGAPSSGPPNVTSSILPSFSKDSEVRSGPGPLKSAGTPHRVTEEEIRGSDWLTSGTFTWIAYSPSERGIKLMSSRAVASPLRIANANAAGSLG